MISPQQKLIRADRQVKKFCAYGFLKNLKFFEPFLILYLLSKELDLLQIGLLISIREIVIQLFELPSGIIADYFGRKKELYCCFLFYILSFISFAYCEGFAGAAAAMFLYGLGEAFRSGTHKAFIYTYLDVKDWRIEKTFVYGLTRSWSLLGTALSALIGIILLLTIDEPSQLFLFAVIPYLLDLALIASYPSYLDQRDKKAKSKLRDSLKDILHNLKRSRSLLRLLIEEGIYESSLSFSKDMIQPLLQAIILSSGIVILDHCSQEQNLNILLGGIYILFNLAASFSSQKAYLIRERFSRKRSLWTIHLISALIFLGIALLSQHYLPVCLLYLGLYILLNLRKPIWVDEIEEHTDKHLRASIHSISSQFKSICLAILSPSLGYIAQEHELGTMMAGIFLILLLSLPLIPHKSPSSSHTAKTGRNDT